MFLPDTVQAKEQVTGGELTGLAAGPWGSCSRGEFAWQLSTADAVQKGGRLSDSEAGSQSGDAHSVGY